MSLPVKPGDPESWIRFTENVKCPEHAEYLEELGYARCGYCFDDLRERLAEAVTKLAYWHNSCADGDTFCGPCISGSPCATAAFLAKEKEKHG